MSESQAHTGVSEKLIDVRRVSAGRPLEAVESRSKNDIARQKLEPADTMMDHLKAFVTPKRESVI
jgi:hypothetical protein